MTGVNQRARMGSCHGNNASSTRRTRAATQPYAAITFSIYSGRADRDGSPRASEPPIPDALHDLRDPDRARSRGARSPSAGRRARPRGPDAPARALARSAIAHGADRLTGAPGARAAHDAG